MFVICYNKVFAVTFDESFAKATGVRVSAYNLLIAVLTAITIVLGMRMMGAMLISSLVIFPALTSMRVFRVSSALWYPRALCLWCASLSDSFFPMYIQFRREPALLW